MLFIMKKLNKKVLNSSLVIILALGLGGCAANSAATTTHQDNTRSAKVTKQSSSKKSVKTSNKAESNSSNEAVATSQSESTAVSQEGSSQVAMDAKNNTAVQQINANTTSSSFTNNVTTSNTHQNTANTESSSAPKAHQEIQLGLGEVASWTDSQGTTHHVDSDGMDRYTTKGSQEVQYQDWSGSLPQNAIVNHQN